MLLKIKENRRIRQKKKDKKKRVFLFFLFKYGSRDRIHQPFSGTFFILFSKFRKFGNNTFFLTTNFFLTTQYGLANQKLYYFHMFLNIETSSEQHFQHALEWLINTHPGLSCPIYRKG